jgi:RNA polymerase sigma-70 factor (TIGR02943 family)
MSNATAHTIPEPEEWVDEYGDALFRFALARIKDPSLAEDLVQETFLAALPARKNFKGRSSPKTWLIAILKNKIIDHFRKKKPEESREDIETFSEIDDHPFNPRGAWNHRPAQWGANPGKVLEQKEFLDVFYQCLTGLSDRIAKAFILREVDGLDTEEICKILKITASNCWVMLYRARMHLRRCLERNWLETKG